MFSGPLIPACVAVVQGRQLPRDYLRGKITAFSRLSRHFDLEFDMYFDNLATKQEIVRLTY